MPSGRLAEAGISGFGHEIGPFTYVFPGPDMLKGSCMFVGSGVCVGGFVKAGEIAGSGMCSRRLAGTSVFGCNFVKAGDLAGRDTCGGSGMFGVGMVEAGGFVRAGRFDEADVVAGTFA